MTGQVLELKTLTSSFNLHEKFSQKQRFETSALFPFHAPHLSFFQQCLIVTKISMQTN